MSKTEVRAFVVAYLEAALWSSTDDEGEPLDSGRDFDDIAPTAKRAAMRDCLNFIDANDVLLAGAGDAGQNGHDYWLTRNQHGAGFWDRGYAPRVAKALTDAAHADGSLDLYVGDDDKVYGF